VLICVKEERASARLPGLLVHVRNTSLSIDRIFSTNQLDHLSMTNAREERGVVQVRIAAAIEVNEATIARFEDGTAWPRHPEEVLMAYATELDMDVRLLWLHAFVLWLEHEPVLDTESQAQIRAALKRLRIS
jgi:hypothetical protein